MGFSCVQRSFIARPELDTLVDTRVRDEIVAVLIPFERAFRRPLHPVDNALPPLGILEYLVEFDLRETVLAHQFIDIGLNVLSTCIVRVRRPVQQQTDDTKY